MSYRECLESLSLPTLYDRRNELCRQLFDSIPTNPDHKLYPYGIRSEYMTIIAESKPAMAIRK